MQIILTQQYIQQYNNNIEYNNRIYIYNFNIYIYNAFLCTGRKELEDEDLRSLK